MQPNMQTTYHLKTTTQHVTLFCFMLTHTHMHTITNTSLTPSLIPSLTLTHTITHTSLTPSLTHHSHHHSHSLTPSLTHTHSHHHSYLISFSTRTNDLLSSHVITNVWIIVIPLFGYIANRVTNFLNVKTQLFSICLTTSYIPRAHRNTSTCKIILGEDCSNSQPLKY